MHTLHRPAFLAVAAVALSACAAGAGGDRLAADTAAALGVRPGEVAITARRDVFPSTYYTATAAGRAYSCQVLTVGFVQTPICTADGAGLAAPRASAARPRRG